LGGPTVDPTWVITDRPVVRSVFTDIEIFQQTLVASGLPPVLSGRHNSG
jgi:hypothetical protein